LNYLLNLYTEESLYAREGVRAILARQQGETSLPPLDWVSRYYFPLAVSFAKNRALSNYYISIHIIEQSGLITENTLFIHRNQKDLYMSYSLDETDYKTNIAQGDADPIQS
jgi:hypothetical protein